MSSFETRWMLVRDLPKVLALEAADCRDTEALPWQRQQFMQHLRSRDTMGFVATKPWSSRRSFFEPPWVIGFMVYTRGVTVHTVHRLVAQDRNPAVEGALLAKLADKVRHGRRLAAVLPGQWQPDIRLHWWTDAARALWLEYQAGDDIGILPILADALEDAGCTDDRLLRHLRCPETGPPVLDLATIAYFAEKPRTLSQARRAECLREIADRHETNEYVQALTDEEMGAADVTPQP